MWTWQTNCIYLFYQYSRKKSTQSLFIDSPTNIPFFFIEFCHAFRLTGKWFVRRKTFLPNYKIIVSCFVLHNIYLLSCNTTNVFVSYATNIFYIITSTDLVAFQLIIVIMNPSLQEDIIEMYQQSLSWYQSFLVQHDDIALDLSHACRSCDSSRLCAPDQPKQLPNGLIYRFDTSFCGKPGWNSLKKLIKNSLLGSDFIESRTCRSLSLNCFRYTLHCNRYKCVETKNKKEYNDNGFTQSGVRLESVKRTKTNGALSTIDAMATKTELRAMKNQKVTSSSKVQSTISFRLTNQFVLSDEIPIQ